MNKAFADNPVELRTAVPPPHFDDRSVVLRAQPVVPLKEIRTKLRLRRTLILCGAFAVAIVLGAASALVAVSVQRMTASNEIPQIDAPATVTAAATQTVPDIVEPMPDAAVSEDSAVAEDSVVAEPPVDEEVRPAKPVVSAPKREAPLAQRPRVVERDADRRAGVQPSEEEQLEQIREAVLYERWQERRARRAARRERRNRDRDLSRVDEIFEGPRRPERP